MGLPELGFFHREKMQEVYIPPAVNFDQIRIATEDIPKEVLSDTKLLNRMHKMCDTVCRKNGYFAVALTQIDRTTYDLFDIPYEITNGIYFSKNENSVSNVMLLNPVTLYENGIGWYVDSCGSIKGGKPRFVYQRPYEIGVEVQYYAPGVGLAKEESHLDKVMAAIYHHEKEHLAGESAVNHPENIIDMTAYSNRELTRRVVDCEIAQVPFDQMIEHLRIHNKVTEWLIYRDQRYLSVFLDGSPVRDFPLYQQDEL